MNIQNNLRGKKAVVVVNSQKLGGAERYLIRLYSVLARDGVEVHVVGNLPGWDESYGRVHRVNLSDKWSRRTIARGIYHIRSERLSVYERVRAIKPDWIHLQFKREQLGFTASLSQLAPVIWTEHGVFPNSMKALRWWYSRAARSASKIICVSDLVSQSLVPLLPDNTGTVVIENVVDERVHRVTTAQSRARAREELNIKNDEFVVLWTARLDKQKMPDIAVEYARSFPDHTLIMLGSGTEFDRVSRSARTIPNLRLTGFVGDVAGYYDAADVFMFTSSGQGEGLPTTLIEASAHDLPVVSHRGSGVERFVRESAGIIIEDQNAGESWREAFAVAARTRGDVTRDHWRARHTLLSWIDDHESVIRANLSDEDRGTK